MLYINEAYKSGSDTADVPKSGSGVREIPIPDSLIDDLLAAKGENQRKIGRIDTQTTSEKSPLLSPEIF